MKRVIEIIKAHVERETSLHEKPSVIDILYNGYTEQNKTDEDSIQWEFGELDSVLSRLTLKEYDRVWDAACRLCGLHERRGFCTGLHMGIHLMLELAENEQGKDSCF